VLLARNKWKTAAGRLEFLCEIEGLEYLLRTVCQTYCMSRNANMATPLVLVKYGNVHSTYVFHRMQNNNMASLQKSIQFNALLLSLVSLVSLLPSNFAFLP
jgi:hypothetical protein